MELNITDGHGSLSNILNDVKASDCNCRCIRSINQDADRLVNDEDGHQLKALFKQLVDPDRKNPLSHDDRTHLMNLIKKAKIEHKVRYVEYHQGCTQPSTFGWEIRTFQGTAIQEVKNVINKIKERLIANGVTKIIIGNQKDSTDAGMYLEFNEENEPEEPWRIPSNFGDFDSRSPAETAGFINFYSAAFLENQEKIALN